jgi:RNA polymerase sigma-70 factor (ECF subfamily)
MDAATKSPTVWAVADAAATDTAQVFDHEAALEACGRGERFALRALFDQESRALLTVTSRILREPERAQDALCEGFVQIWRQAASFQRALGSGQAWMHALVRQVAMEGLRRLPASDAPAPGLQPPHHGTDDTLAMASEPWRAAWPEPGLRAIYLEGATLEQVARSQSRPVEAVRSHLRQALLAMRAPAKQAGRTAAHLERVASAGEFVWGSLTPPERQGLAQRMGRDRALLAEVHAWQGRLLSLMPPRPAPRVPVEAWPRIAEQLGHVPALSVQGWWRTGAMRLAVTLTAMLCMGLGLMLMWAAMGPAPATVAFGGRYMAVLNSPQEQATWVVVGTQGGPLRVTPLSTPTPVARGSQLVLWMREAAGQAPQRVGQVAADRPTEWPAGRWFALQPGQSLWLTEEERAPIEALAPRGAVLAQGTMEGL